MVIANVLSTYTTVSGLWQYDYGQVLRIQGIKLPPAVEIHFSLQERGGESVTRVGTTKDNVTDVVIPDSMLENGDITTDYKIYAFIYLTDSESGQTEYKISMSVKSRPRPEQFEKQEDGELFRKAISEVNKSATSAQESATKSATAKDESIAASKEAKQSAEAASVSAQASKNSADASKGSEKTASSAATEAVNVKDIAVKAADSAYNSALASSRSAKEAKQSAEQADTAAKSANESKQAIEQLKTAIDTTAEQIATDRTAVETDKKEVQKAKSAVEDLKGAIEQKSSEAITNIGTAKDNAIKDVNTAKDTAVSAVTQEKESAVNAVNEAKDAVVAEINENENVQKIQKNKDDIAELRENLTTVVDLEMSDNLLDNANILKNKRLRSWSKPTIDDYTYDYENSYVCPIIAVIPGSTYVFIKDNVKVKLRGIIGTLFFKEDGSFLSSVFDNNIIDIVIPDEAYYVSFATNGNDFSEYNFKLYNENMDYSYTEYGYKAKRLEKIEKNIASAKEIVADLAIKPTASGSPVILTDSAEMPIHDMNIYGKSWQTTTKGINLMPDNYIRVDSSMHKTESIDVEANTKYDISFVDVLKNFVWVNEIDENGEETQTLVQRNVSTDGRCHGIITTKDTTQKIYLLMWTNGLQTNADKILPQIAVGDTDIVYEQYTDCKPSPSIDYPQEVLSREVNRITVNSANILNILDKEESVYDKNGLTYSIKNGVIKAKGTATTSISTRIDIKTDIDQKMIANKPYIFIPTPIKGSENENVYLDFTNSYSRGISLASKNINTVINMSITDVQHVFRLYIRCKEGTTIDMEWKPQLLISNSLLSYQAYTEQIVEFDEPVILRGLPVKKNGNCIIDGQQYMSDRICKKDGVWGVERNVVKYKLNTKDYSQYEADAQQIGSRINVKLSRNLLTMFGDDKNSIHLISTADNTATYNNEASTGKIWARFFVGSDVIDSIEKYKEYISSHDVYVYPYTSDPAFEPFSDSVQEQLNALATNLKYTTVFTDNGLCELTYIADPKTYIDNKFNELSNAIIASASEEE